MIVLDASLMIARILREPHQGLSQDIFDLLDKSQIVVPGHWPTEIANALRTNIRRGRIARSDVGTIVSFLSDFYITVSPADDVGHIGALTLFALEQNLTAYDAAYIQVAIQHCARLATVDTAMRAAAQRLDISLLPA